MKKIIRIFCICVALLLLLLVSAIYVHIYNPKFIDKKINWTEQSTENSIRLSFEYFDGEKSIPINAKRNERISIHYGYTGKGGIEFTLIDPRGFFVEIGTKPKEITATAKYEGNYSLVIKGNKMSNGSVSIDWKVE